MTRIENDERIRIFGPPCTPDNHRTFLTPWGIRAVVHAVVLPRFAAACDLAKRASSWQPLRIDSYACRKIRGRDVWSIHAWAMAWDFFASPPGVPPPGGVWTPDNAVPPAFAAAFERYGFTWGANFDRVDVPHIEWAAGRPDPLPTPPQEDNDMALTDEQARSLVANAEATKNFTIRVAELLGEINDNIKALVAKP